MTITWVLLIIGSAFIHLIAHIGMKKAKNRLAFICLMFTIIVLFYSPILIFLRQPITINLLPTIVISALLKTCYFLSVKRAYDTEDLSVAYPVMGGTAPIFLLFGSLLLLKENLTIIGIVGIILIALGLWSINLLKFSQWKTILRRLKFPGLRWALIAGLCIATYTLVDKIGVQSLNPFYYVYINNLFIFLFILPLSFKIVGISEIKKEFESSKWIILLSGITTLATISLVLFTVSKGMPAAYAGSIREISIVLSGLVGLFFLKEKYTVPKIAGSVLIAGGVALISIFG